MYGGGEGGKTLEWISKKVIGARFVTYPLNIVVYLGSTVTLARYVSVGAVRKVDVCTW